MKECCVFFFFHIYQHVSKTEQSWECPQHKNAYEKTLRAIHAFLSDNNESSK